MLVVAATLGRYPPRAAETFSSAARVAARWALSCGLFRYDSTRAPSRVSATAGPGPTAMQAQSPVSSAHRARRLARPPPRTIFAAPPDDAPHAGSRLLRLRGARRVGLQRCPKITRWAAV